MGKIFKDSTGQEMLAELKKIANNNTALVIAAQNAEKSAEEAAKQATSSANEAAKAKAEAAKVNEAVAALPDGSAVTLKVAELDKAMAIYDKTAAATLSGNVAKNKMLTMNEGGAVLETKQSGWSISRITPEQFTFGDTAFLNMKPSGTNLMAAGAVLFAAEEEIKDAEGNVVFRKVTSLFRAGNTDIPESGFVIKSIGLKGQNLLVSHPTEVTSLTFGRNGMSASMATMEANITEAMNQKVDWNSRQPGLTAGMATEVEVQTVRDEYGNVINESEELLTAGRCLISAPDASSRDAASTMDGDTSVSFKTMRGVTLGGNQLDKNIRNYQSSRINLTIKGKVCTVTTVSAGRGYTFGIDLSIPVVTTKRYILLYNAKANANVALGVDIGDFQDNGFVISAGAERTCSYIIKPVSDKDSQTLIAVPRSETNVGASWTIKDIALLDLTTLFPTDQSFVASLGNDEASVQKVLHRLGFFSYSQKL